MIEINKCKLVPGITSNWGDILGDITKQQDLVDYVAEHGGGVTEWGSITGDIGDQEDLATLLEQYAMKEWVQDQGYLVQSDLNQYATRQWVTGRGYATEDWVSNDYTNTVVTGAQEKAEANVKDWVVEEGYINQIKTVNNQSLIGTGNIEISGLTPAQEDAIDPLMNVSGGVLYTEEIGKLKQNSKEIDSILSTDLSQVGDDVYLYNQNGNLYKFNRDSLSFELINHFDSFGYRRLWKDATGRMYDGLGYELHLDTGIAETRSFGPSSSRLTRYDCASHYNLLYGQHGIWLLDGSTLYKFDETNQVFVSGYTIKYPEGYSAVTRSEASGMFRYKGHNLLQMPGYSETFEYSEWASGEGITVSVVTGDYFVPDWNFSNATRYRVMGDGELYYVEDYQCYKYDSLLQTWNLVSDETGSTSFSDGIYNFFPVSGNLVISEYGGRCLLTNVGDPVKTTYWSNVSDVAVDLKSYQTVMGHKDFDEISVGQLYVSNLNPSGNNTHFNLNNNVTEATAIKIVSPNMTLNNHPIATTDMLIMNREKTVYGPYSRNVYNNSMVNPYEYNFFSTHTGRLFYCNPNDSMRYEWDGSSFVNHGNQYLSVYNENGGKVIVTPNDTFFNDGSYIYLWDDTNSDFVQICSSINSNSWTNWWDGSNLRTSEYKLVNNGGTWEWVSDQINDYKNGMYHYVNSTVYCLCENDTTVYEYDPTNKTYEALGFWNQWTMYHSFVAGGDIIFPYNGTTWMKIDFSKITPERDNYITSNTTIPFESYDTYQMMHYEFNGELLYADWYNIFACWGIDEETPEVPAVDGTYALKATVLNGVVTYSWEPEV